MKWHLVNRQVDSRWLRRAAFEEFVEARNSGRLIGFVGSFASAHLGYPGWADMWKSFYDELPSTSKSEFTTVRDISDSEESKYDQTTLADLGELYAGLDRGIDREAFHAARKKFMDANFDLKQTCGEYSTKVQIASILSGDLGIRRLMTLNYDFELEWPLMTLLSEAEPSARRCDVWQDLLKKGKIVGDGSRLSRFETGRGLVASDVAEVERSDSLIEFALRQPALSRHIMHLHGRSDIPESTLVTRRDYRERYWRDGSHRLPYSFANRLLFLGNPVLFVGLGAREPDVMRTLEQFLSDNPNRRRVPTFLLWNADKDERQNDLRRVWFYRQYGIHLLFDTEIALYSGNPDTSKAPDETRMADGLRGLSRLAEDARKGFRFQRNDFRNPQDKFGTFALMAKPPSHIALWSMKQSDPVAFEFGEDAALELFDDHRIKLIEGDPGSCRGACAQALVSAVGSQYGERPDIDLTTVSINASFAFETSSLAAILSGGFDGVTAFGDEKSRMASVQSIIPKIAEEVEAAINLRSGSGKRKLLVLMINGADRFVAHDGSALSSEIDHLVRILLDLTLGRTKEASKLLDRMGITKVETGGWTSSTDGQPFPLQLVLVGTPRVRRYLENIGGSDAFKLLKISRQKTGSDSKYCLRAPATGKDHVLTGADDYFSRVAQAFSLTDQSLDIADRTLRRRQFLGRILEADFLERNGVSHSVLALEILRSLAFIGQPAEVSTLSHLPEVQSLCADDTCADQIRLAVDELLSRKLILEILPFRNGGESRYGLHKTLVTEFRERFGVPLSDSRLAAGFNLSLFAAQPSDNYVPDVAWHDDLGSMVDWLLGSYRDQLVNSIVSPAIEKLDWEDLIRKSPSLRHYEATEMLHRLGSAEVGAAVRAAVSLLRGYYSIPALLMQDNRLLDFVHRDGPLTEHGERLARVLRVLRDIILVRRFLGEKLGEAEFSAFAGPEPLYADEILWVQNEIGVLKTAQGELYRARNALREAERINSEFVEFGDRGPNWIRLQMNQVQIDIERGKIVPAEERLRTIEMAINDIGRLGNKTNTDPFLFIAETFSGSVHGAERDLLRKFYADELVLLTALTICYRGFCAFLRGSLEKAREQFELGVGILNDLGEMRAYSFFQRHLASLYAAIGRRDLVVEALNLCVSAAGPGRQPDIDHSGRIASVQYSSENLPNRISLVEPSARIPQLMESYRYAQSSDMYRLQVETAQIMALVHLDNGDTDSALRFVHEAMAIAARGGFALRKITLRVTLGRIHAARRDYTLARNLLVSAAKLATRIRYERAVEAAENELVKCSLPVN